jgi:hypothetical protein
MPPEKHALLGASSAHRWLNCPGSARLTENMPDTTSEYAEAGRLAHEIAELKARQHFIEPMPKRSFNAKLKKLHESEHYDKSMDGATDEYLDYLKTRAMSYPIAPTVALEVQVDFSDIVPEGFGTADCIMIGSGRLDVADYKNGSGVLVEAENNPQMMLYAWGALRYFRPIFGDSIHTVHMSIVQPNAGGVREWEMTVQELYFWGENVARGLAQLAWAGAQEFHAGDWCKFCKAKATCMERAKAMFDVEPMLGAKPEMTRSIVAETDNPETQYLTDQQIGDILTRAKDVAAWLKDLEEYALRVTLLGTEIPGWKAVEGRGSREWIGGSDTAFDNLMERGVPRAVLYEEKPVSVAGLEKALGKKTFAATAEGLWCKTPGKPTLVPESDKRPPYNPAAAAFEVVNGE